MDQFELNRFKACRESTETQQFNESNCNHRRRRDAGPGSGLRLLANHGDQATRKFARKPRHELRLSDASGNRFTTARKMSEMRDEAESCEGRIRERATGRVQGRGNE